MIESAFHIAFGGGDLCHCDEQPEAVLSHRESFVESGRELQMLLRVADVSSFELDLAHCHVNIGDPARRFWCAGSGMVERSLQEPASLSGSARGKPHVRQDDRAGQLVCQVAGGSNAGDRLRKRLYRRDHVTVDP